MNAELRKKREELEKKLEYAQNAHMAYAKVLEVKVRIEKVTKRFVRFVTNFTW